MMALCVFCVPALGSDAAEEEGAQQAPQEVRVTVTRIIVEGNIVLSDEDLWEFGRGLKGDNLSLEDMQQIAAALQQLFFDRGYRTTLVVVPPQEFRDGVLRLRVAEGRVGRVLIEGNEVFSADHNYLPYLPSEGEPLNWHDLRRGLDRLNAHPDKTATAVLRAGEAPGTSDLHLLVKEDRPYHLTLRYDNIGTIDTPRSRAYAILQYDNFFGRSQIGMLQFGTSPADLDKVRQYAATYQIPLGPLGGPVGHSVILYGGFSETSTNVVLDVFSLSGKGDVIGAQYRFPLPDLCSFRQELAVGAEFMKIEDVVSFGGAPAAENEVRALPLYVLWNASRRHGDGVTGLSAGARYQKDGLIYNFDDENYRQARAEASTDFLVLTVGAQRVQHIGKGWTCSLTGEAQLSNDRLIPSEQYGLGGYDTVRGYRRRVIIADEGVTVRAELRTPVLPRLLPEELKEQIQLLAFLDYGLASNMDVQPGEFNEDELLGTGLGMRAALLDSTVTARVDVGWGLRDLDATSKNEEGECVGHVGVECRF